MKALITGGSSGIGRDMARILAKLNYNLILVARNEDGLTKIKNELETENNKINITIYPMDLNIKENCYKLYENEKNIDVLINNAGFGLFGEFAETDLVLNFFLAKTERIKEIHGWDPKLKLQEHTEFFYRAKLNNLKVGFTNELSVQHHPVKLKKYSEKRNRNYTNVFMDKYAIDKIVANYDDNRGQVITLRENLEGKN